MLISKAAGYQPCAMRFGNSFARRIWHILYLISLHSALRTIVISMGVDLGGRGGIYPPNLWVRGDDQCYHPPPHFFIQKLHWVEKFQICCISTIQRWTNTYFFWFKIGRKSFNFLKSGYMTVISLSTSVTNTIKDDTPPKPSQLSTLALWMIQIFS